MNNTKSKIKELNKIKKIIQKSKHYEEYEKAHLIYEITKTIKELEKGE